MREQLIKYVELLFAGTQDAADMQQEILQNTLDRYDDLISQGKSPEAAYRLAISGIGDVNEILGNSVPHTEEPIAPAVAERTDYRGRPLPSAKKKTLRAVAIGMYICCVVPVIALGNLGDGILGVCLMFLMIAAATVLIIMSSGGKEKDSDEQKNEAEPTSQQKLDKSIRDVLNVAALIIFFALSFATGAWYITWLVFPIMGAVKGIINACMDLKEARKHEN